VYEGKREGGASFDLLAHMPPILVDMCNDASQSSLSLHAYNLYAATI